MLVDINNDVGNNDLQKNAYTMYGEMIYEVVLQKEDVDILYT